MRRHTCEWGEEKRKKEKNVDVFYSKEREEEEEVRLLKNERFWSFYWGILPINGFTDG